MPQFFKEVRINGAMVKITSFLPNHDNFGTLIQSHVYPVAALRLSYAFDDTTVFSSLTLLELGQALVGFSNDPDHPDNPNTLEGENNPDRILTNWFDNNFFG